MLKGLAFEAHGQNTLARFTPEGTLVGFDIRDFGKTPRGNKSKSKSKNKMKYWLGGVMCHLDTIKKHTGIDLELMQGSSIISETLEDGYNVFFHAGIQSHLHRIIRATGLHFNGKGWEILAKNLRRHLDGTPLLSKWLNKSVSSKSLMRMKITGLYRDVNFLSFPWIWNFSVQSILNYHSFFILKHPITSQDNSPPKTRSGGRERESGERVF